MYQEKKFPNVKRAIHSHSGTGVVAGDVHFGGSDEISVYYEATSGNNGISMTISDAVEGQSYLVSYDFMVTGVFSGSGPVCFVSYRYAGGEEVEITPSVNSVMLSHQSSPIVELDRSFIRVTGEVLVTCTGEREDGFFDIVGFAFCQLGTGPHVITGTARVYDREHRFYQPSK